MSDVEDMKIVQRLFTSIYAALQGCTFEMMNNNQVIHKVGLIATSMLDRAAYAIWTGNLPIFY